MYRVPGNSAAVTNLTDQINNQTEPGMVAFKMDDPRWSDVNVVSSLLKSFFRKLPEPLFTSEMYPVFIEASKQEDPVIRLKTLKKLAHDLPDIYFNTLKHVIKHLTKVMEKAHINKMELRNLAIVFGPTLVRPADDNMLSMVTDMSQQCRIIETILGNSDWFFSELNEDFGGDCITTTTSSSIGLPLVAGSSPSTGKISQTGNETLLLSNLQKLEDSGKVQQSPSRDVSAKDIVSGIISAANRKIQRTSTTTTTSTTGKTIVASDNNNSCLIQQSSSTGSVKKELSAQPPPPPSSLSSHVLPSSSPAGFTQSTVSGISSNSTTTTTTTNITSSRLDPTNRSHTGSRRNSESAVISAITLAAAVPQLMSNIETATTSSSSSTNIPARLSSTAELKPSFKQLSVSAENISKVNLTVSVIAAAVASSSPAGKEDGNSSGDGKGNPVLLQHAKTKKSNFPIDSYQGLEEATAQRVKLFEDETKVMLTMKSPQLVVRKATKTTTTTAALGSSSAAVTDRKSQALANNNSGRKKR